LTDERWKAFRLHSERSWDENFVVPILYPHLFQGWELGEFLVPAAFPIGSEYVFIEQLDRASSEMLVQLTFGLRRGR
jgi:hypothetical protein